MTITKTAKDCWQVTQEGNTNVVTVSRIDGDTFLVSFFPSGAYVYPMAEIVTRAETRGRIRDWIQLPSS